MRLGDDSAFSTKAQWLESGTAILTKKSWKPEMLHFTKIKNEQDNDLKNKEQAIEKLI